MGGLSRRRFRLNPRPLHRNSRCKLISNALAFRMTRQAKPRRSKARQVKPRSHRVVLVCVVVFGVLLALLRMLLFVHGHIRR